jgi:hypothetical protein
MNIETYNKVAIRGISSEACKKAIRKSLTILNPAYAQAEKKGQLTDSIPRYLQFYEETQNEFICPRGALVDLYKICKQHSAQISWSIKRLVLDPVDFTFKGNLLPNQQHIVASVLEREPHGILVESEDFEKIRMCLNIIAHRKQRALIICHTTERLNKCISAIENHLGIPADEVGVIDEDGFSIGHKVTVALIKSLSRRLDDVTPHIGHVVVDECHRAPSRILTETVNAFPAKYRLGLTSKPYRSDGLHIVTQWHVGPITGGIDEEDLLDNGNMRKGSVLFVPTGITPVTDPSDNYDQALNEMTLDLNRNQLIARTVVKYKGEGLTLILSEHEEHCECLAGILNQKFCLRSAVLTSKTPARQKLQIIEDLKAGKYHYLVATNELIEKGFDLPKISALNFVTPTKGSGRLLRHICRVLRQGFGKEETGILDFVDDHGEFAFSARSRWEIYEQLSLQVTIGF